ncbi:MAG: hypothetical protein HRT44_13055 [Bdellovibrionales bacterium]|nr:hypothetical protein [Bdellovibrionales bacterium]
MSASRYYKENGYQDKYVELLEVDCSNENPQACTHLGFAYLEKNDQFNAYNAFETACEYDSGYDREPSSNVEFCESVERRSLKASDFSKYDSYPFPKPEIYQAEKE